MLDRILNNSGFAKISNSNAVSWRDNDGHVGFSEGLNKVESCRPEILKSLMRETDEKTDRELNRLSRVVEISQNRGSDAIVRLKNGCLKSDSGIVKRLIFKSRYKAERREAARNLGLSGETVSAASAASKIQENLRKLTEASYKLQTYSRR